MWTGTENKVTGKIIELYFIRHGKTKGNMEHRYRGLTDEPLTEEGRSELGERAEVFEKIGRGVQLVFCGPMIRCQETKEILFPGRDSIIIDKMTEIDFGEFEGKNHLELDGNMEYQAWIDSGGTIAFPGGESREDFISRSMECFHQICEIICSRDCTNGAIVLHGGNIMSILSTIGEGNYFDYQIKPGKGYRCIVELGEAARLIEIEEI
ncbi:MAG: histidine phosphatase family protein [Agathobacter sp.]|nr:histidine phosphatase family protein [Agathobacter sp.]